MAIKRTHLQWMQKSSVALKATQPDLATHSTHASTAKLVRPSVFDTARWNLKQKMQKNQPCLRAGCKQQAHFNYKFRSHRTSAEDLC